ncbi:Zn(II)2Cys6 transcription factor domain-containing protein [Aspergillus aculeatinus CBS 121060]|uniref:Uncharacterized protein n=1 Tax=Aspergillus aculeatinus CBS 121060 TaxID=1448322 RepID=A0ACD1HPU7_9EURO|nr:hypothetical protein BO66DRAFT_363710 [Aspergillus aculeatinus CBS 121060]RAH75648.1 hypothetical protein BO66DRAFT_363710 [Aspergillus aculeatinus CBS 121060]
MEQSVEPTRQRRPRVERGRSRNGCQTCLGKRVKCDEQHPDCKRCVRLGLTCEWGRGKQPLAARRRGLGPIKRRDSGCWRPSSIQPRQSNEPNQRITEARKQLLTEHSNSASASSQEPPPSSPITNTESLALTASAIESSIYASDSFVGSSQNQERLSIYPFPQAISDLQFDSLDNCGPDSPLSISSRHGLSSIDSSSSSVPSWLIAATPLLLADPFTGPSIGSSDTEAVSFHRSVFASLKSSRSPSLSAHSLFLDHAWDKKMAFHFLLALSHSELAIHFGYGARPTPESCLHLQRGSELLIQARNPVAPTDHLELLLSFLYIFMFWMRRERISPSKLRALSATVLAYIREFDLIQACASDEIHSLTKPSTNAVPYKVLLSRVLVYLYDRDGFCSFFGCGGLLASYMSAYQDQLRKIWRLSRTAFLWNNARDPLSSPNPETSFHEVDEAATLHVYFEMIGLHHEINRYSQSDTPDLAVQGQIQRRLDQIRQEHASLFDIVTNGNDPSLMAMVTVAHFHALYIYLTRSRASAWGSKPVPIEVQSAMSELVTTLHYTISRGNHVQLMERFQWSLLILGVETQDPVHWEWVDRNISDVAIREAFSFILAAKRRSGGCIPMALVRQLICCGEMGD